MIPTLKLGPLDSPKLEVLARDIEPLVVLVLQSTEPLSEDEMGAVWSLAGLDTLFLSERSQGFFEALQRVCRGVVNGELVRLDPAKVSASEFHGFLDRYLGDGVLSPGAKEAAQRYLDFLDAHPGHWPFRGETA